MNSPITILSADPIMSDLASRIPMPIFGNSSIFISLVRAIISQQLSEAVAKTIFKKLTEASKITPSALIDLNFDVFRSCGISARKCQYIKSVSEAALDGRLNSISNQNDEDAIKMLVALQGVGRWTAEMILIFALGREDIWPNDDAGLLRAAKKLYKAQSKEDFIKLGDRFKPYRSYAAWYLWKSLSKNNVP